VKVILRDDESGISEVIGTILILAMTVVLFSTIIIWVTNIPTPAATTRLEIQGNLLPIYDGGGIEIGGNITLRHVGGESLDGISTLIYVSAERAGSTVTELLGTRGTTGVGLPYGLADGADTTWNVGERWTLTNYSMRPSTDSVTVTIVDSLRAIVLWSGRLTPPAGSRPPVFLEKWADDIPETALIDPVRTGLEFWIFARVTDPDGDLDNASVYGILTINYPPHDQCGLPIRMYDDGTRGDLVSGDSVFTLSGKCLKTPTLDWDGSIVLLNATDRQGHATSTRLILNVILGPDGGTGQNGTGGSGRPQNLRWNGRQGYNVFNASQWDKFRYTAKETRTFRASEEAVVVVGSLDLENTFDTNQFIVWDPFSGYPPGAVVYGSDKGVDDGSEPSSSASFTFLEFINGYYVYAYRFHMNDDATVLTNFFRNPVHPPNYHFARYSLDISIQSASGTRFNTTDSINITDEDGFYRNFPQVTTYADAGFTQPTQAFDSTDIVYVQANMFTVDPTIDPTVQFGNIVIKDFQGGTQLWRSPASGNNVNSPICNVNGNCASGDAISRDPIGRTYRFAINLSRADQDPWVEGPQNYALTLTSIRDTDETYASISSQLVIDAPLYKLDIVIGNDDTVNSAWGSHDYGYYYENVNGVDRWRKERIEFCSGSNCAIRLQSVAYLDFDQDGDLDATGSWVTGIQASEIVLYRRDLDFTGNVVFTRFLLEIPPTGVFCNVLATGDVTGDGAPEVVCGASNGNVWYYKNDGSLTSGAATKVIVDQTRPAAISSATIADFNGDGSNDIAVSGSSARLTWYPNLDGLGRFQNTGIIDDWFAEGERSFKSTLTSGSYLTTFEADNGYEQIREIVATEPVQTGGTTNPTFDGGASGWTYADWESGAQASGTPQAAGGNPGAHVDVQTAFLAGTTVSGYWRQSFAVSGSPPFTVTVDFDRNVSAFGGGSVTVYVFVDTGPGTPTVGTEVAAFTHTATSGWISSGAVSVPSSKVPVAGTYYLKIAVRTSNGGAGGPTTVLFDNSILSWTSTGGDASEFEHYWRISQLPNRPVTTYTFNLEARHNVNSEGDNFAIAYSQNVVGNDPATGTYATMVWVNATSDQTYSFILPSTVAGRVVWIRGLDMDRRVGNTSLDTLFMDQMYVRADTPAGTTGASLNTGEAAGVTVSSIDADDQNGDGFADLAAGTSSGKIFKFLGGSPGLPATPTATLVTGLDSVVGVKFGAISASQAGLEVVVAYGKSVRVYTAFGSSGSLIGPTLSTTTTPASGEDIAAFGVGDVNGDGFDDVVVGTASTGTVKGELLLWINRDNGLVWNNPITAPIKVDTVGTSIRTLALGDASKAQYLGR